MGKTSQSSTRGKQDSVNSAKNTDVSSGKVTIWPEWTDAELAAEKWDLGGAKGKDKGRASQTVVLYEDPEGVVLPPSLGNGGRVCWKRITDTEVMPDEQPVIVSDPECTTVDLVSANSHLLHSELMCWVISQLQTLWQQRHCISAALEGSESNPELAWRPWEHIHPHPKGTPAPQVNAAGKYCVRLYWMGAWRKVTIDDQLPFREPEEATETQLASEGRGFTLLLPATPSPGELWPALLTKAILKIAALDYGGGSRLSEFGECSVVHLLTGWTLQVLPISDSAHLWELLTGILPLWERPAEQGEGEGDGEGSGVAGDDTKLKQGQSAILLASFTGGLQESDGVTLLQPSLLQKMSTSEGLLKRAHTLSPWHSLARQPSHPMLLTLVRNEPLEPPPKEPPPPTLQAPYYLGLRHRQTWPGDPTPPPTPHNAEQRFVEIFPPFPPSLEDSSGERGSGRRVWMDYPDFVNAFTSLHVFRNPSSFPHRKVYCNLSHTVENSALTGSGATTKKTSTSHLASVSKAAFDSNKDSDILFVDSPALTELHLVFSSLSNWREGRRNLQATTRPSVGLLERPSATSEPIQGDPNSSDCTEADESPGPAASPQAREHIAAGTLTVTPYCWSSLEAGPPVLRMATTGTRGTTLSVPAGRHLFTLHVQAPLGHHLEIFSLSRFQLTNRDAVFSLLSTESSRLLLHCSQFTEALFSITEGGGESQAVQQRVLPLVRGLKSRHMKLMLASSLHVLSTQGPDWGLNESMTFSWRAFLNQVFSSLESHLPSDKQPAMDVNTASKLLGSHDNPRTTPTSRSSMLGSAGRRASALPTSTTRTASREQEHQSEASGDPKSRPLQRASTVSTMDVWESLKQSVPLIQPHSEALGTAIFSGLFKLDPSALRLFPFHKDEQMRAFSRVVAGPLPSLQPHSWMVVFREVFNIQEPQLIVPVLHCPVNTCLLRVIDNDSGAETPRVFQSVAPHTYQPNKAGYTFVLEAWSGGEAVEGGRWEQRLVCSSARVPVRREAEGEGEGEGKEVGTTFHTHEIQEYCLPNRENQLFRFAMKVAQDCPISVQLSTSKRDAYFKLEVLDHETPVAETQGRGHGVIPVYTLLGGRKATEVDAVTEEEEEQKEATSVADLEGDKPKPHKYILQATIVRDSWPMADTAWPYISMIKSMEKLDDGRPGSAQQGVAKKTKGKEKGGGKKGAPQSVPAKQMDTSKPHWTLRIVTRNEDKECLEVHKDTERAAELKSMVQAWEAEQPGRCKKAQESRQKFLESRALKDTAATSEEDQSTAVSVLSESSSVPQPPSGPVQLRQIDLSPFIVSDSNSPRLLDEKEQSVQQQERQRLFREYRAERQTVLQRREADRETRNQAKVTQLELAEQWQTNLDELRNKLNAGRQAIRERHLAKERAKMEAELAAQKAAEEQAMAGRESKKGKGKGKKK